MKMNKDKVIKLLSIVIGLLITIGLIWFGLRFVQRGRAVNLTPDDIKIENITATSFRVSYQTASGLTPIVKYGQSSTALNFLMPASETKDADNGETLYVHDATLLAGGTYYFVIIINDQEFNNAGVPFSVQLTDGGTGTGDITPTKITPTEKVASVSPTLGVTPTIAVKPLSDINDCQDDIKNPDGTLKDGYTARDWAQCIKQNPPQ